MRLFSLISFILRKTYVEYRSVLWRINKLFRKTLTFETKQGVFTVPLDADDPIGMGLYVRGGHELEFINNVLPFLRENNQCAPKGQGTVLDIGANNGVIFIGMLLAGEFDKAIAIEPDPRNFSILEHNVSQNCLVKKSVCLNYAAANSKSTLQFELSEVNYGDHRVKIESLADDAQELLSESNRHVIQVEADTIDTLLENVEYTFRDEINLIWIDVQGFEGYVFQGARKLLSKGVPVVSEIWPYGILRAGMSEEMFCQIAESIWSFFWVSRRGRFVKYPITVLNTLFTEFGPDGGFGNVIFTNSTDHDFR